ncbi:MAG: methionine--tRNA ligase [Sulfolobales archaeon]|nr:methionine--tRNA ligase [Sulfolobales archaeon]
MKVFVASAWPYVNAVPHLGTMIGSVLSADVFARYARLKYGKENVLFVSGSDEHGTPIEVEARKKGVDPKVLTDAAHEYVRKYFLEVWEISYDNYTRTESEVHKEFVRRFLLDMLNYIFVQEEEVPYCEYDKLFLPDRFVAGTCPYCGFPDARGDQCDNCGRLLTPRLLINPRCVFCGRTPVFKVTKHWFFDLSKLQHMLREWLESSKEMPQHVKAVAFSWLEEGLKPRSLTRDNKWGIPAPFEGSQDKTVYVWFEALLGYISATIEYFKKIGQEEKWKEFWFGDVRSFYFIGKDNIPFHAIIFPAMLMATGKGYVNPTVVAATEYLLYEGQKFSKSRRIGVWIDEAKEIMDIEYWRFALIRQRPEERDTNFTWKETLRVVNTELNDDIGNYVNRVLSMINRYFDSVVPGINETLLKEADKNYMRLISEAPRRMGELFEQNKLKAGTEELLKLAREGNAYLNQREPWALAKTNKEEAGNVLTIGVNSARTIAIMLYPLMPRHAEKLYNMLGLSNVEAERWDDAGEMRLNKGHRIGKVEPLFRKIELTPEELERKLKEVRHEVERERPELLR